MVTPSVLEEDRAFPQPVKTKIDVAVPIFISLVYILVEGGGGGGRRGTEEISKSLCRISEMPVSHAY